MKEIHLGIGAVKEVIEEGEFLGEVPASEFITGDVLASALGLTAGTTQHSDEPWLKFSLDGKTLYVAKKTFRRSISWDQINARGAVYGTRTIEINGESFKVRLLKGASSDPAINIYGYDPESSHRSEWNRLLYPLVPNPTNKPASGISGEGIVFGSWAGYTEAQLEISSSYTWCQESSGSSRVLRGYRSLSYINLSASSSTYGWRPVLELIP